MTLAFLPAPITPWPLDRLRPYARKALTPSSVSEDLPANKILPRTADDLPHPGGAPVAVVS